DTVPADRRHEDWILTRESNPLKWICEVSFRECFLLGIFPGVSEVCPLDREGPVEAEKFSFEKGECRTRWEILFSCHQAEWFCDYVEM
ncbi:hypothetical protein TcasGA2_TC011293, partial [Tribolium castaneum]